MSTDVKSKTFLNSLSAATASIAALQTTSGADNLSLATAAGTGAFHDTDQACALTIDGALSCWGLIYIPILD